MTVMFELEKPLRLDRAAVEAPNIAHRFSERDLANIGSAVVAGYKADLHSRNAWERRMSAGMDLAMQMTKEKTFPWAGASNVAFPLVTIATMQFHARAYPDLVPGDRIVKMRQPAPDPTGEAAKRADLISAHMSYQVLEQDRGWEEAHDSLLINYSVVGTAFKKVRHDGATRKNVGELVLAKDLVLDYYATSVDDCPRKTHVIPRSRNEIYERVKRGTFRNVLDEGWYQTTPTPRVDSTRADVDSRAGMSQPAADFTTPFTTLEQHVSMDLDDDGYAEPYIIVVEEGSATVLQISLRFDRYEEDVERAPDGSVIRIYATEYFQRYLFLPSPDGGVYGLGFGVLLGPLNESVNSIVNQLVDAGTMSNTAGGFLAKGAKIRGGVYTFAPLEWKRVDSTGEDLQKSIFPLPVREPSNVLFQLLGLLIQYADRIPGTNEISVGENIGQNTPAQTAETMNREGRKVYGGIYKRAWRAMKGEFERWYRLNAVYLPDDPLPFGSSAVTVSRELYLGDPASVVPAADPNAVSETERIQQALALTQAAYSRPGYDYTVAERRWLEAMHVQGIDEIYPGPGKTKVPPLGQPDPKITVAEMKSKDAAAALEAENMRFSASLMAEMQLNEAKMLEMQASAAWLAEQINDADAQRKISLMQTALGALKERNQAILQQVELMLQKKKLDIEDKKASNGKSTE